MPSPRRSRDASQEAVRAVTDTGKVNGDLLGSPELKRKLREAKKRIA
jgi:hypothetical protein